MFYYVLYMCLTIYIGFKMTLLHKNQFCLSHDKPTSKLNRFEKDVKKFVLLMIIIAARPFASG